MRKKRKWSFKTKIKCRHQCLDLPMNNKKAQVETHFLRRKRKNQFLETFDPAVTILLQLKIQIGSTSKSQNKFNAKCSISSYWDSYFLNLFLQGLCLAILHNNKQSLCIRFMNRTLSLITKVTKKVCMSWKGSDSIQNWTVNVFLKLNLKLMTWQLLWNFTTKINSFSSAMLLILLFLNWNSTQVRVNRLEWMSNKTRS